MMDDGSMCVEMWISLKILIVAEYILHSREMKEKEQGKFRSARQPQSWNRTLWKWTAGLLRFLVDFFSSLSLLEQTKNSLHEQASHATNRHTNRKLSCLWKSLSSFLHFIRSIFGSTTSAVSLLKFPRLRLDWHLLTIQHQKKVVRGSVQKQVKVLDVSETRARKNSTVHHTPLSHRLKLPAWLCLRNILSSFC